MSPFYEIPWPVLLAAFAAVVILCVACYLAGFAEGEAVAQGRDWWRRGPTGEPPSAEDEERGTWRW